MPRRRVEVPLEPHRTWVWAADAEWRWRRAVRLLLQVHLAAAVSEGHGESDHGDAGGGVGARFDRAAGGESDH